MKMLSASRPAASLATAARSLTKRSENRGGKPWVFILPESFDPDQCLESELKHRSDDARYLVSLVFIKTATGDVDHHGYARLRAAFLRKIMHKTDYKRVVKSLVEADVLKPRAPYTVGKEPFGFQLAERFANDRYVAVPATDKRLIRCCQRVLPEKRREHRTRWLPVHHVLSELQHRMGIDGDAARQWLAQNPEKNKFGMQSLLVDRIESGQFSFNVGEYERVTNSITNLKRELRAFLAVDGERLWQVDAKCCQPALLLVAFTGDGPAQKEEQEGQERKQINYDGSFQNERRLPIPYDASFVEQPDVRRFLTLTRDGTLYDVLREQVTGRGTAIDRETVKRQFMCDVIAKRGRYPGRIVEQVFDELFPTLRDRIRAINQNGLQHENLIRELHRAEARFVIGTVATDLVRRFPGVFLLTLHDAIFTTAEHVHKVTAAFDRAFEQTGIHMRYTVKDPDGRMVDDVSSVTTEPMDPVNETTDAKTPRRTHSDHGRTIAVQGPELVSVGLGLRWPRLEAAL